MSVAVKGQKEQPIRTFSTIAMHPTLLPCQDAYRSMALGGKTNLMVSDVAFPFCRGNSDPTGVPSLGGGLIWYLCSVV